MSLLSALGHVGLFRGALLICAVFVCLLSRALAVHWRITGTGLYLALLAIDLMSAELRTVITDRNYGPYGRKTTLTDAKKITDRNYGITDITDFP